MCCVRRAVGGRILEVCLEMAMAGQNFDGDRKKAPSPLRKDEFQCFRENGPTKKFGISIGGQ